MSSNRSWTEIDLGQIRKNYEIYASLQPQGRKVMAVVKADAYGHGDVEVARVLSEAGCTDFAVSNIEEAIGLRLAGIRGQILILGYTPVEEAGRLAKFDITQALLSEEYFKALAAQNKPVKCHFALDTGMRRIGLNTDDPENTENVIRSAAKALCLTGLFTHLCVADTDSEKAKNFTKEQIRRFEETAARVADLNLPYVHCLNSAGGLRYPEAKSCFSRLGIILYGLKPDDSNTLPEGIRPALTWKSAVSMVKTIHPGDTVGYGRTFLADRDMSIATVSCGYADGYNRLLSNKGFVLIHGKKAPIVGRVCMDQFMVDVSGIENVKMADEAVLIGDGFSADDMAKIVGSIGYEIVCDISGRVERRYIGQK